MSKSPKQKPTEYSPSEILKEAINRALKTFKFDKLTGIEGIEKINLQGDHNEICFTKYKVKDKSKSKEEY